MTSMPSSDETTVMSLSPKTPTTRGVLFITNTFLLSAMTTRPLAALPS